MRMVMPDGANKGHSAMKSKKEDGRVPRMGSCSLTGQGRPTHHSDGKEKTSGGVEFAFFGSNSPVTVLMRDMRSPLPSRSITRSDKSFGI